MATSLSGIIIAKNEAENILDCIKTLDFCDEIIVIDDYSNDKTISKIKKLQDKHIKIIQNSLNQDFSEQRNFALSLASSGWALFIDADERIPDALKNEIKIAILNENTYNGFYLKRLDTMWGKKLHHGEIARVRLLRLAKKAGGKWHGRVHERWKVEGKIGLLNNPLEHYPHKTIRDFLKEINEYTTLRAKELYEKKVSAHIVSIIFYPAVKFIQNYFVRFGFLDGIEGFLIAAFMSFHSFLVRAKLFLLWKKK